MLLALHLVIPDGVFTEAGDGFSSIVARCSRATGADLLAILDRVIHRITHRLARLAAVENQHDHAVGAERDG